MKFANQPANKRLPGRDGGDSRSVPYWWPVLIWLPLVLCCALVLTLVLKSPTPASRPHTSEARWRADAKTFVSVVRYLLEPEQDGASVFESNSAPARLSLADMSNSVASGYPSNQTELPENAGTNGSTHS